MKSLFPLLILGFLAPSCFPSSAQDNDSPGPLVHRTSTTPDESRKNEAPDALIPDCEAP